MKRNNHSHSQSHRQTIKSVNHCATVSPIGNSDTLRRQRVFRNSEISTGENNTRKPLHENRGVFKEVRVWRWHLMSHGTLSATGINDVRIWTQWCYFKPWVWLAGWQKEKIYWGLACELNCDLTDLISSEWYPMISNNNIVENTIKHHRNLS